MGELLRLRSEGRRAESWFPPLSQMCYCVLSFSSIFLFFSSVTSSLSISCCISLSHPFINPSTISFPSVLPYTRCRLLSSSPCPPTHHLPGSCPTSSSPLQMWEAAQRKGKLLCTLLRCVCVCVCAAKEGRKRSVRTQ